LQERRRHIHRRLGADDAGVVVRGAA
jgi:hypothetical protein